MNWINTALLSTAIFGVVSIFDSHLIAKRMPSFRTFMLPAGIAFLIYGLVLFYLFPLPEGTGLEILLIAIAAGIFNAASVTIMLYTLKREEVSRVIPIVHTYPIFVAMMAVPLLGESLYYLQWLAIIIVVAGAVTISFRESPSGSTTWLGKTFLLLFGSGLLLAMANIASKYVLAYISFWNLFWFRGFCLAVTFLAFSMRPHTLKQLINMKQRNSAIALLTFNELLALVAIVLSLWSMQRGPVSLVSTIIGSRPIFVLIYSLILSRVSPMFIEWQPGRRMLALRLVAIAMIVGGLTIIHLT